MGDETMIDLKKDVMEAMDKLNSAWTKAIKDGSQPDSEGIDLGEVLNEFSGIMKDLDDKWNTGMLRIKDKKGKFW